MTTDLSSHAELVMDELGQPVTIENRTEDTANRDDYNKPSIDTSTVNVSRAIVDLQTSEGVRREEQGFEHAYDAQIYVPKGTTVNEAGGDNLASRVTVDDTGVEYQVEKKDIQNGLIRLDCDRMRQ